MCTRSLVWESQRTPAGHMRPWDEPQGTLGAKAEIMPFRQAASKVVSPGGQGPAPAASASPGCWLKRIPGPAQTLESERISRRQPRLWLCVGLEPTWPAATRCPEGPFPPALEPTLWALCSQEAASGHPAHRTPRLQPAHLGPGQFLLDGGVVGLHVASKLEIVDGVFVATVHSLRTEPNTPALRRLVNLPSSPSETAWGAWARPGVAPTRCPSR